MKIPIAKSLEALPGYFGGKRRLLTWIGTKLNEIVPASKWPAMTFIDLFMGAGSVSLWAKAQGFKRVISNDISLRSHLLGEAFLLNTRTTLSKEDAYQLPQELPESINGWIESNYALSVFSQRHAKALDTGYYWAQSCQDPTKRALLLILMWHLTNRFVSFATSLNASNRPFTELMDGFRPAEMMNPKRFTDGTLKRLYEPSWSSLEPLRRKVNAGVIGGAPVTLHRENALTLLPDLQGDILFLDPPYPGTVSYEKANHILDSLLAGEIKNEQIQPSPFSKNTDALHILLEQAQHIPVWILCFGNQVVDLEGLVRLVESHAPMRHVKGFTRKYAHLNHVSKTDNNQELLVIAYPKTKE